MDWSVNENGHARIGATQACLTRLHSHFMAEWKPGHGGTSARYGPESFGFQDQPRRRLSIANVFGLGRQFFARVNSGHAAKALWSFRKQSMPYYCAVQHENACFEAKFFVTFSFGLG
ncbi:hypothetical protein [Mesorhizobium sp. 113-1-2]|uniref:hypothetical protein n=1 Tax=Mesorhizobium sp. 113-1-2 TaxID=2744515 RepID=UPI000BBB192D|nr:hypothetical protein [Mesorhizobium sp. 113-1-2]